MEEERDSKQLYDVSEMHDEYDGELKDHFPHRPMTNLQIHDTISSTGKCSLYILLGIQVVVILILIILLGINGVTLTQLNSSTCDSSTGGLVGSTSSASDQILNITRQLLSRTDNGTMYTHDFLRGLTYNMSQVIGHLMDAQMRSEVLGYNMTQLSQQLGGTDAKVDGIRAAVDEHMVYTLNMSDVLNQVLETTGDSAQKLVNIIGSLTNLKDTSTTTAAVVDDILVVVQELLTLQNASSIFNSIQLVSCKDIKAVLPNSPTGYYHVNSRTIYCNMDTLCSSSEGWTRIAYLDMSDSTQSCPSGFRLYQSGGVRACGRAGSGGASCTSQSFTSLGLNYSAICGKVIGYQYRSTDASVSGNINSHYVDGISITRGSPRQHVWTLVSGWSDSYNINPCRCNGPPQAFVGNNYYCESGNPTNNANKLFTSDPLWDGQNCRSYETACCNRPGIPWFHRDYGNTPINDNIEMRVCGNEGTNNEDVTFGLYEFYVK